MITAIQHTSICSKMVALETREREYSDDSFAGKPLRIEALLYLATMGGASLCNMEHRIGSFAEGKSFDALVVSVRSEAGNPAIWSPHHELPRSGEDDADGEDGETPEGRILKIWLERFLFGGDDRNIRKVFVQGKCVGGKAFHPTREEQTMEA